ncbi:MAG: hypothetical protein WKG00_35730 [Polyangiaceae bacterium]
MRFITSAVASPWKYEDTAGPVQLSPPESASVCDSVQGPPMQCPSSAIQRASMLAAPPLVSRFSVTGRSQPCSSVV